jgi:hypothetical protein
VAPFAGLLKNTLRTIDPCFETPGFKYRYGAKYVRKKYSEVSLSIYLAYLRL